LTNVWWCWTQPVVLVAAQADQVDRLLVRGDLDAVELRLERMPGRLDEVLAVLAQQAAAAPLDRHGDRTVEVPAGRTDEFNV
jgi:hypothetical protein